MLLKPMPNIMSYIKRLFLGRTRIWMILVIFLVWQRPALAQQGEKVTLQVKNTTLDQVLKQINSQVQTQIVYQVDRMRQVHIDAFSASNEPMGAVLDRL